MRLVYTDEAGSSRPEPMTVVAAVIIRADAQWRAVENEIARVLDQHVPPGVRDGFIFHGLAVFNGGKNVDRHNWSLEKRLAFFEAFVSIPRRMGIPVSFGGASDPVELRSGDAIHSNRARLLRAFVCCVTEADKYLSDRTTESEIAVLVCEDNPEMRQRMREAYNVVKRKPVTLEIGSFVHVYGPGAVDTGHSGTHELKVCRIVDQPHFTSKQGAVMLQLADACAFTLRRHFSGKQHSGRLIRAMYGSDFDISPWLGGVAFSVTLFRRPDASNLAPTA